MKYTANQKQELIAQSQYWLANDWSQDPSKAALQLRAVIEFHEWRYYVLNDPILNDFDFDQLFKKLEALEAAHPNLVLADSPTQRIGNDLTNDFPSVEHLTPMLSLSNSYNGEDLKDFDQQIHKLGQLEEGTAVQYVVEPKYDGGTIVLVYENDKLVRAATRGNGALGELITANARTLKSVPLKANFSAHGIYRAELRGEVVIEKGRFDAINAAREEEGKALFANPRNAATGGLRMKNPAETATRGLEAFIFQLGFAENEAGAQVLNQLNTHHESIELLNNLGFKVPQKERKLCANIEETIAFCQQWEIDRDAYNYEIDGMVVKVNDYELQEKCGYTSHHPRWAMAYKFKAKQATSKLIAVEYQVGKIGSITPVAKVEPVALAGVTVSSISLHNADFISEKDLRLNDMVVVERAGDVIPYIARAVTELRTGDEIPIEFPKFCPINTTDQPVELVREADEAAWRCPHCVCGQQDLQRMIFHVSKSAMDIDGLGKSQVERFHQLGWLKTIADIYRLDYGQISELEGFGEKSAKNLRKAIEKAKQNPIYRLLHSLSVHHLGKKASKLIAAEVHHVLDLANWTEEDFTHLKDIGPVVAKNVAAYFAEAENIAVLKEMEEYGVNLTQTDADKPMVVNNDGPLSGKSILFTGSLQQMTRKAAQEKAAAAGARNISAVSSKLDILVVGEKAGSKLKKAEALGTITIYTESEFLALFAGSAE